MRRILFFLLLVCCTSSFAQNSPLADPKAVITEDHARFMVLRPNLIRMEWSESGTFTNEASFVVVNRKLPVPRFVVNHKDGWLEISTDELELRYQTGPGKFSPENLLVSYKNKDHGFTWTPGMAQQGNLKGTYRTLDRMEGNRSIDGQALKLEDGLLSTDGWTLIDDSKSLLFDNSPWPWVKKRSNTETQDWYLLVYGHDYPKALYAFTQIAGKVPLPPRYAFGYWWSRYWSYSDKEVRDLVGNFEKYRLPLDVMVIDMDWHRTDSLLSRHYDAVRQPQQWTGWTWNRRLFPDPDAFLSYLKSKDLKVTLNLHPASGIAPYEEPYKRFVTATHFDTVGHRNIPFAGSDKSFMQNLFSQVLHPMEKAGVSFWWLDWQQWRNDKAIPELNNTWWLNYTFFTDQQRNSINRPLLYHRWGGLGNHRYQIGFSGDVIISWKSLAFQPYFTATASNVLYGYWSHDIGGHMFARPGSEETYDPELYTRWMQLGALSPIFRTHSSKDAELKKEAWNFTGEYFDAITNAIRFRYTLDPYIYTMARKTYDTGLSICRPLYYAYPEEKAAYTDTTEYQFGDALLVAPIGKPMENGLSKLDVWLPPGNDWFEWQTGTLLKGNQTIERNFILSEYPIYVKAGSVIPLYPEIPNLSKQPAQTIVGVFPGGNGNTTIYEDGSNSKDYDKYYATTKVTNTHLPNRQQQISIEPRTGNYPDMPQTCAYTIRLFGAEMPQTITANGKPVNWNYDGRNLSVNVELPKKPCTQQQTITIQYSRTDSIDVNTGLLSKFKTLSKAITALKYRDAGIILPELAGRCEETDLRLQYYPYDFYQTLCYFNDNYPKIPEAIATRTSAANAAWLRAQLHQ